MKPPYDSTVQTYSSTWSPCLDQKVSRTFKHQPGLRNIESVWFNPTSCLSGFLLSNGLDKTLPWTVSAAHRLPASLSFTWDLVLPPPLFPPSFLPSTQLSQLLISAACHTKLLSVLNPSPRSLLQTHFCSVVVLVAKFRQWLQTKVRLLHGSMVWFLKSPPKNPHAQTVQDHEIIFISSNAWFHSAMEEKVENSRLFPLLSIKLKNWTSGG